MLAACAPGPTPAQRTGGPGGTTGPRATSTTPDTNAEPGVITGRVTTEQGEPIPDAQLRIVGFTGSDNLGQDIETVTSGGDGVYRYEAGSGLYQVLGTASIEFDGQTYVFDLEPWDGECGEEMSDQGIVEDFVLRLTGISPCNDDADPTNHAEYRGAAVQLFGRLTASYSSDTLIEFVLEPTGPLADGRIGQTLTMTRTVGALQTSAGPLESTWILHDIPLARYEVTATLREPDGGELPLLLALGFGDPADAVELTFDAKVFVGTPVVGYLMSELTIYDTAGG